MSSTKRKKINLLTNQLISGPIYLQQWHIFVILSRPWDKTETVPAGVQYQALRHLPARGEVADRVFPGILGFQGWEDLQPITCHFTASKLVNI